MKNILAFTTILALSTALSAGQQQRGPDTELQREAMKKLAFLAGKWSGDASVTRGPGGPIKIQQSEDIQFKLDGLVMLVEGTGRDPQSGKVTFGALAIICYDEESKTYRFRTYNDGRYLDTELKVVENGFEWSYRAGPLSVKNTMRVNEKGDWIETTVAAMGDNPPRKSVEMSLKKIK